MSYKIECTGKLQHASPLLNATLLSLFVFTRHGARTASKYWGKLSDIGKWNCANKFVSEPQRKYRVNGEYKVFKPTENVTFHPSCGDGELLDMGFQQQVELGSFYRKYLVDELNFLPEKYEPSVLNIRSSFVQRCQDSAIGFMQGLYPPQSSEEILDITTGKESNEPLCPFVLANNYSYEMAIKFTKTEDFKIRKERALQIQKPIIEKYDLEMTTEADWMFIGDFINVIKCGGHNVEDIVTEEIYSNMMSNMAYFETGYFNYSIYHNIAPVWNELLKIIDKSQSSKSTLKFGLFSGHDVTVSAILVALDYIDLIAPPPYRSHIDVELWKVPNQKQPLIRFVYNGEVIPIKGEETIPLNKFREFATKQMNRGFEEINQEL